MRSLISLLLFACSTSPVIYERGELKDLILRPRPGHVDHLTNQRCTKYKGDKCLTWDLLAFNMSDEKVRNRLRDLKFICNVNGERFRICPTSRGLCQQFIDDGGWFKPDRAVLSKYISFEKDYQYMIDSKVWCAAQDSAEGKRMFAN